MKKKYDSSFRDPRLQNTRRFDRPPHFLRQLKLQRSKTPPRAIAEAFEHVGLAVIWAEAAGRLGTQDKTT